MQRLARRTIGFSKPIIVHNILIGLFINSYEFGLTGDRIIISVSEDANTLVVGRESL